MEFDQQHKQALQQVKAFATKSEYFGIPADIVYAIGGVSVGVGAALHSLLVIAVFLLFFGVPAYRIHRADPFALKVWVAALKRRRQYWCAGQAAKRELVIITREEP
jgi:hypothetical protein